MIYHTDVQDGPTCTLGRGDLHADSSSSACRVKQVSRLQVELQDAHKDLQHNPHCSVDSRLPEGRLALESLQKQNDRLRKQHSTTLQAQLSSSPIWSFCTLLTG